LMLPEWYAVRTRSRHEQRVTDRLTSKAFEVFYPTLEVWSQWKDRKTKVRKPMFPGYLFIQFELTREAWIEVLKTPGVANLLGYADEPTPVPQEQIHSVQTVLAAGVPVKPHPYLNIGDKVIVVEGPLKGAIGIFTGFDHKKGKLIISVDLLSRSIEVELESRAVEKF